MKGFVLFGSSYTCLALSSFMYTTRAKMLEAAKHFEKKIAHFLLCQFRKKIRNFSSLKKSNILEKMKE